MMAAIGRLSAPGSAYREQAREIDANPYADEKKVVSLVGVLRALRDDYAAGYMQTVTELVHQDLFADFLTRSMLISRERPSTARSNRRASRRG
jgi:hypothetical protein